MKELKNKMPEVCEIVESNILDTIDEIKQHGRQINPEIGEHLDNLLHSAKSLLVIKRELREEEEGEYGRGSYGQRRSAVTGRYMDGYADGGYGPYSGYNDGSYGRMYRDDGKEQVREHLRQAMQSAQDPQSRRVLEEAMRKF